MTQTSNSLFDEFARLVTDATGVAQGLKREIDTMVKTQAERFLADMDLVRRDEFEVVREMASAARAENERLTARLAELEEKLAGGKPAPKAAKKAPKAKDDGEA